MKASEAIKIIEAIKTTENGQDECVTDFVKELRTSNIAIFDINHLENIFVNHQSYWCYENDAKFFTMTVLKQHRLIQPRDQYDTN